MTHTVFPKAAPQQPPPYHLGLIGFPLGHSLSPQIHAAALHALKFNGEYSLFPVHPIPAGSPALENLIGRLRGGRLHGLNVTIPHKAAVIPLLDELTPAAKAIGAVNTIVLKDGDLLGDNTDAPGFWADIQACFHPDDFSDRYALILGAGGAARAVAYALLVHGYRITIAARRLEQAEDLCDHFSTFRDQISTSHLDGDSLAGCQWALIVNTTPVGMIPHIDASPWPRGISFPEGAAIYDLVYNPVVTTLVADARRAGLIAVTGLGMLVEQAALSFERWTGVEAPRVAMREVVAG
jgi:shikimate dehydrogenase